MNGRNVRPRRPLVDRELFSSFWGAGFESACHINKAGVRLDMVASTQHDRWLD